MKLHTLIFALSLFVLQNNVSNARTPKVSSCQHSSMTLSCQTKQSADNKEEATAKKQIADRLSSIYRTVFSDYNKVEYPSELQNHDTPDNMSAKYLSQQKMVLSLQDDDDPFYGADHWIMGQDWGKELTMQVVSINLLNRDTAEANIKIRNFGSWVPLTLIMVRQGNDWYIDDFITIDNNGTRISERKDMQQFINEKQKEYIPMRPDYADSTMWISIDNDTTKSGADVFYVVSTWELDWHTSNGHICHYADVWNPTHREHMATEILRVAEYMSQGNRFYAPYYRHTTIEAWVTQNEDTIQRRTRLSMHDIIEAFDYFQSHRDQSRPLIIAGFSQGGMAIVELLKHMTDETYSQLAAAYVLGYKVTQSDMEQCHHIRPAKGEKDTGVTICYNTVKDVSYVKPVLSQSDICINPVNWRTDAEPATLHDTITITLSPTHHVLVASNYSASEYAPYGNFINIGDIHSCEPWLYSECLRRNISLRSREWRKR